MGFHAGRRVVGLRTYIGMACALGTAMLGFGYYALFHTDLTDRAARAGAAGPARPNMVVVLLRGIGPAALETSMPALAGLRADSLWATWGYAAADDERQTYGIVRTGALTPEQPGAGGPSDAALMAAGYFFADDAAAPPGDWRDRLAPGADRAAAWIAREGRTHQPFFLTAVAGAGPGDTASADAELSDILERLDERGLAASTVVLVTGLSGDGVLEPPDRWRVPFILRYPRRFRSGGVLAAPVTSYDVMPSLFDFAGIPADESHGFFGQSVSALWLRPHARAGVIITAGDTAYAGVADRWVIEEPAGRRTLPARGAPDPPLVALLESWQRGR